MSRYSVCAPMLFGQLPLDEAVYKIAALGFKAYEFWTLNAEETVESY